MDVEEANKFINALVKNLQVLCHGHVSFNNSIQVIGHLYLNVDSNTNIDYIVNEKVCKNDTSSTVFVSKSYHSEPKSPEKPEPEKKKANSNPGLRINLKSPQGLSVSRQLPEHKVPRFPNIHPAYRDRNSGEHTDQQQPPSKMPRFSLPEFKVARNYEEPVGSSPGKIAGDSPDVAINLCEIKKEPDSELHDENLQSSDHSNEPVGNSSVDYGQINESQDESYSNQYDDSLSAIPVTLHENKHNLLYSIDSFSQFTDPSNIPSSSQYGAIGLGDPNLLHDSHFKMNMGLKAFSDLFPRRQQLRTMSRETHDTIVDLVLGRFSIPKKDRSMVQKAAVVRYYRSGKEKWMVKPVDTGFKLFYTDQEVEISNIEQYKFV